MNDIDKVKVLDDLINYCDYVENLEISAENKKFNEWLERHDFDERLTNDLDRVLIEEFKEEQYNNSLNITAEN